MDHGTAQRDGLGETAPVSREDNRRLIEILEQVPETRLEIIGLAARWAGTERLPNPQEEQEIMEARQQAQGYCKRTAGLMRALESRWGNRNRRGAP